MSRKRVNSPHLLCDVCDEHGERFRQDISTMEKYMKESSNRTCYLTIVETLVERCVFPDTDDLQEEVLKSNIDFLIFVV